MVNARIRIRRSAAKGALIGITVIRLVNDTTDLFIFLY